LVLAATDAFDGDTEAELCQLAGGDAQLLDRAIPVCMAQPTSLPTRAIELLGRVRYEDLPPSA
jgi:hypothetical protein